MKKTLVILLATIGTVCVACCAKPEKRNIDDIFHDVLKAVSDSTATSQHVLDVLNEYADSLYSGIINSETNDAGWRALLQKRAGDAISISLDYLFDEETRPGFSEVIQKFDKVLTTWIVRTGEPDIPGCSYIKEVMFVANKNTDHESDEVMNFVVWTGENPKSLVIIPKGDENESLLAVFCPKAPEGSDQIVDLDSGITLEPTFMSHEDGPRCYVFDDNRFFEQLMANDHLFVLYTVGDGYESIMLNLERFHEQVHEAEGK